MPTRSRSDQKATSCSTRTTSTRIISIAPSWDRIEWRLGGVNSTIAVHSDEQFTGQHTTVELSPGRVLMFDNRTEQGGYSRALELAIEGDRAHTVWEWRPQRDNFAFAVGSARRLPNGDTLVGFGMSPGLNGSTGPTEVYEVTNEGDLRWHLEERNTWVVYRSEPLWTIAGETEVMR